MLTYFTMPQAQAALERIRRSLMPGGYRFGGHVESLRGSCDTFGSYQAHGTILPGRDTAASPASPPPRAEPVTPAPLDADWMRTIERSAARIGALHQAHGGAPGAASNRAAPLELSLVLDALRNERFERVLERLGGVTAEFARDPGVLLLKAVSLCQSKRFAAAETECRAVLARDAGNPGAHYMLALCREHDGDAAAALDHAVRAAARDAGFAMPQVHLGLLAKRRGDLAAAVPRFARAIDLLSTERSERLVLFGGGFGREALIRLCRAEREMCERRLRAVAA